MYIVLEFEVFFIVVQFCYFIYVLSYLCLERNIDNKILKKIYCILNYLGLYCKLFLVLVEFLWRVFELLCMKEWNLGIQKGDVYSFGIILQEIVDRIVFFDSYDMVVFGKKYNIKIL